MVSNRRRPVRPPRDCRRAAPGHNPRQQHRRRDAGAGNDRLLRLPIGIFCALGVKAEVVFFDRKPAAEAAWTGALWIYDLHTNMNFTLKQNPLQRSDLDEFVACLNPANRQKRKATWWGKTPVGRWRSYTYDELLARDKVNLDIFWLRDGSLEDSARLSAPDGVAAVERARRLIPGIVSAEIVPKAGHLVTVDQPKWLKERGFRFFDQGGSGR